MRRLRPGGRGELEAALREEHRRGSHLILPIRRRRCEVPAALALRHVADFIDEAVYLKSLRELVMSMGLVFNGSFFGPPASGANLGSVIDKAVSSGFPLLSRPFHRPFQYIGPRVAEVVAETGGTINAGGNVIVESADCRMVLWAEGSMIGSVDAELPGTAGRIPPGEFDPDPVLGAFSINPAELQPVRCQAHCHSYYGHRRGLKVFVMRDEERAPLRIGFSAKYYGK